MGWWKGVEGQRGKSASGLSAVSSGAWLFFYLEIEREKSVNEM